MSDAAPPEEPKMDIHKPKPIHNWRELLTEIGVVVIGVGIALGAEQAVEWLHWQHRVADARAAMVLELRDDDAPQAYARIAAADCFERQLTPLRAAIEAGRPRAEIMTLVDNYKPNLRTWDMTAWNTLLGSDVAAHIQPEQLILWSMPYIVVPRLASMSDQERQDFAALRPARLLGEHLSPAEADTMLAVVARLRSDNRTMLNGSRVLLAFMKRNSIEVTPEQQRNILAGLKAHFQDCVITPSMAPENPDDQTQFLNQPPPPR